VTRKAAIIGGGVIGGGWAARFLLNGWDVAVADPDPEAGRKIGAVLENARHALPALYDRPLPAEGRLTVGVPLAETVAGADWVQESVPERLAAKHAVFEAILAAAPESAVVASSTSGFKPSELNRAGDRVVVAHPFNPVYLLPLVEVVGAEARTAPAAEVLRGLGMLPLVLGREIDAHVADRLLEAVWREALWLVKDDIATTAEIDDAIRMGLGLRWAQMGLFETYRIAGGEAGMAHFLAQFGPALQWPWTKLTDVPDLDEALVAKIAAQSDAQSGARDVRALERLRDDNLVAILRALKRQDAAAGAVIAAHEAALPLPGTGPDGLPVMHALQVPPSWADYNGHMNEVHYLEAAGRAGDRLMVVLGADAAYVAGGRSYFTAESHVAYLSEVRIGTRLTVTTQALAGDGRKLHLFHRLWAEDGEAPRLAATVETMLLHVDLATRRVSQPAAGVAAAAQALVAEHERVPRPDRVLLGRRPG
jgi:carnitine 3-dehydrogenase